jgi:hypothetical protein
VPPSDAFRYYPDFNCYGTSPGFVLACYLHIVTALHALALGISHSADYTFQTSNPRTNRAQLFRGYAQMGDFLILFWVEFRPRLTKPAPDLPT